MLSQSVVLLLWTIKICENYFRNHTLKSNFMTKTLKSHDQMLRCNLIVYSKLTKTLRPPSSHPAARLSSEICTETIKLL